MTLQERMEENDFSTKLFAYIIKGKKKEKSLEEEKKG